jgi:hypothetical protein
MKSEDYSNSLPEGLSNFLQEFYSTGLIKKIINYTLCNDDIGVTPTMLSKNVNSYITGGDVMLLCDVGILVMREGRFYPSKLTYLLMKTFVESALLDKVWEEE